MKATTSMVLGLLVVSTPAAAEPRVEMHGLILGQEGARYVKGVPTLDLQQQQGVVQVRFLGFDHNKPVFAAGFFNGGTAPVNVGIEDIHATMNGSDVPIFTVEQLAGQAKKRAMWAQFGMALATGLSASAAASQKSTYYSRMSTPYGSYSFSGSYPSIAGQLRASQIRANGAYNAAFIQQRLDDTLAAIGDHVVQRTTVDPGRTYAGLVVLDKFKYGKPPFEVRLNIDWNGERYPFAYLVQRKGGDVAPQYKTMLAANAKPKMLRTPARLTGAQNKEPGAIESGAIFLRAGIAKVPAKTASGYCLDAPPGYQGTGSGSSPVVTKALPLCL